MWTDAATAAPDIHVGFRGTFTLDSDARVDLRLSGASWYVVWIDGEYFTEGPDRYTAAYPEYQLRSVDLKKGKHTIAVQLQYEGVVTRILHPIQPFLYLEAAVGGKELPIDWRCQRLAGYSSQVRRINPQLSGARRLAALRSRPGTPGASRPGARSACRSCRGDRFQRIPQRRPRRPVDHAVGRGFL